jgi:hypothetical protein
MSADLDAKNRDTVEQIFNHGANVEWRRVKSLLKALGTVTEEHDGRVRVTLGDETETFDRPHDKDVGVEMLVDLRRMLTRAGTTS